jgi:AraC-like DNA-binding protein
VNLYRELAPHAALRPFVRCYWLLRGTAGHVPTEEKILPDGRFEVVFHRGDRGARRTDVGLEEEPGHVLIGEVQRPVSMVRGARMDSVGIRFEPGGAHPFFAQPASELVDRVADLTELWSDAESWLDRLVGLADEAVVLRLDELLIARLRPARIDRRLELLLIELRRTGGHVSVSGLADQAGLSPRQLERVLTPALGLPPKRVARILRFQGAFAALLAGDRDRAFAGYFDHSHLLRDFREFAGAPPTELLSRDLTLNRRFHGVPC